ncbi:14169_t:CDS:1, partial [Acaulospora morrowiae]
MSANKSLRSSKLTVRPNYNLGDMSKGRNNTKSKETTPYLVQKPSPIF